MDTSSVRGPDRSSSIADLIAQASELNEDGVYELSSGRSMEAIPYFQQAWDSLMQAYEIAKSNHSLEVCHYHSNNHRVTSRLQIPYLQDDVFYIYSCAVAFVPPTSRQQNFIGHSRVVFQCAIVLFNMALAYHQHGKKVQKEGFLRTALTYYQDCHQALQSLSNSMQQNSSSDDETRSCQDDDDLILLTLAVMNNQAHIEYELQDDRSNVESFQKLWNYSLHYAMMADDDTNFSTVEQSQIHEFVQNAMVFRLQRPCAAPTA